MAAIHLIKGEIRQEKKKPDIYNQTFTSGTYPLHSRLQYAGLDLGCGGAEMDNDHGV